MTGPREPCDVIDSATGRVRVLARRCATCIFWRDHRSPIGEARTDEVIAANVQAGALLTCHSSLPYGAYPEFAPAVCAGFWAEHRGVPAGRIAELLIGVDRVEPPGERTYLERGRPVTLITRFRQSSKAHPSAPCPPWLLWHSVPKGAPRNCSIRRQDGSRVVRPFRGLRRPQDQQEESDV